MSDESLSEEEMARVDALAKARGVTREEMLDTLAARGRPWVPAHAAAERRGASRSRICVEVARGAFASERWVMFSAEGKTHALIVDARDVEGDLLGVTVVRKEGEQVVVELPRAAIAGRRVKVPADSVLDETSSSWPRWALLGLGLVVVAAAVAGWLLVLRP
jgi:hypothetical protein